MELRRKTLKLMGSHIDILIFDSIDAESILDDAVEMLKMYEHRFSANDDSSELMEVNHSAGIKGLYNKSGAWKNMLRILILYTKRQISNKI